MLLQRDVCLCLPLLLLLAPSLCFFGRPAHLIAASQPAPSQLCEEGPGQRHHRQAEETHQVKGKGAGLRVPSVCVSKGHLVRPREWSHFFRIWFSTFRGSLGLLVFGGWGKLKSILLVVYSLGQSLGFWLLLCFQFASTHDLLMW